MKPIFGNCIVNNVTFFIVFHENEYILALSKISED